jgi:hypothetical protein
LKLLIRTAVKSYNSSTHSTTGFTPIRVALLNPLVKDDSAIISEVMLRREKLYPAKPLKDISMG